MEEFNSIADFKRRLKTYARADPDADLSQYWPVAGGPIPWAGPRLGRPLGRQSGPRGCRGASAPVRNGLASIFLSQVPRANLARILTDAIKP